MSEDSSGYACMLKWMQIHTCMCVCMYELLYVCVYVDTNKAGEAVWFTVEDVAEWEQVAVSAVHQSADLQAHVPQAVAHILASDEAET